MEVIKTTMKDPIPDEDFHRKAKAIMRYFQDKYDVDVVFLQLFYVQDNRWSYLKTAFKGVGGEVVEEVR